MKMKRTRLAGREAIMWHHSTWCAVNIFASSRLDQRKPIYIYTFYHQHSSCLSAQQNANLPTNFLLPLHFSYLSIQSIWRKKNLNPLHILASLWMLTNTLFLTHFTLLIRRVNGRWNIYFRIFGYWTWTNCWTKWTERTRFKMHPLNINFENTFDFTDSVNHE